MGASGLRRARSASSTTGRTERLRDVRRLPRALPSKKRNQIRREVAQPAKDGVDASRRSARRDLTTRRRSTRCTTFYRQHGRQVLLGPALPEPRASSTLVASGFADRARVGRRARGAGAIDRRRVQRAEGRAPLRSLLGRDASSVPFLHFNVCYYHGIGECIARGLRVFEPGAGGEHKLVRGFVPTMTHSAHWVQNPRFRHVIDDFLARERAAVAAFVESGGQAKTTQKSEQEGRERSRRQSARILASSPNELFLFPFRIVPPSCFSRSKRSLAARRVASAAAVGADERVDAFFVGDRRRHGGPSRRGRRGPRRRSRLDVRREAQVRLRVLVAAVDARVAPASARELRGATRASSAGCPRRAARSRRRRACRR